ELHMCFGAWRRAVGRVRGFVATSREKWGIIGEPAEDIRLCVSELASNALAHGTRRGHGFLVRLCADEHAVLLEVHDSEDVLPDRGPRLREAADTDTAGRGLRGCRCGATNTPRGCATGRSATSREACSVVSTDPRERGQGGAEPVP